MEKKKGGSDEQVQDLTYLGSHNNNTERGRSSSGDRGLH